METFATQFCGLTLSGSAVDQRWAKQPIEANPMGRLYPASRVHP